MLKTILLFRKPSLGEKMLTKERIKREIDRMPDELLEKVYKYIHSLAPKKNTKKKLHTYKLKGQFDHINARERAYE
jgi:DNA replication initiation complex subunit (GINS family)